MTPRLCSKTTDRLMLIGSILKELPLKRALITWDRIEDPEEGTVVVPILDLTFKDEPRRCDHRCVTILLPPPLNAE